MELRDRLHAEAQKDPDRAVRIDGDTRVPYQDVVHLPDLGEFEGLMRVALRTLAGRWGALAVRASRYDRIPDESIPCT